MADSSLRQGQIGPRQDGLRDNQLISCCFLTASFQKSIVLPDGVIGNTWAFGAYVPGSSPGRVGLKFIIYYLLLTI